LLKNSHIIPDFMYQDMYDEKHKMVVVDKGMQNRAKTVSSGEYESNLLCAECDNKILGTLESYASSVLYGGNLLEWKDLNLTKSINQNNVKFVKVEGINYAKFKLFLLSLIWRAGISNRDFFSKVDLGPHEEMIRQMIYSGNAGEYDRYPCNVFAYVDENKELPEGLMISPIKINSGGIKYLFMVSGLIYIFYISSHRLQDWIYEIALNNKGELIVPYIPTEKGREMLNSFIGFKYF